MKGCELHLSFLSWVCDGFCLFYCKPERWGWKSVSAPNSGFPSQEYCYHYLPRAKLSLVPSKGEKDSPVWAEKEEGAQGTGAFAPKQDKPCVQSQISLGLGYPSRGKKRSELLHFVLFLSKSRNSEKPLGVGMPGRVSLCCTRKRKGGHLYQKSLWREAWGIPQDTSIFLETDTLVLLQANPRCRVSPDNVGISRDSREQTDNPLYKYHSISFRTCVERRRKTQDSTHRRGFSCE